MPTDPLISKIVSEYDQEILQSQRLRFNKLWLFIIQNKHAIVKLSIFANICDLGDHTATNQTPSLPIPVGLHFLFLNFDSKI